METVVNNKQQQSAALIEITQDRITLLPAGHMCPCTEEFCNQYGDFEVNINNKGMGGLILCRMHLSKYFKLIVR